MKSELLKQFRKITDKKAVENEKKILIFLVFLLISSVIWLFNALNKTYETEYQIPIVYKNLPIDYSPSNTLLQKLSVRIKATGFNLLSYNLTHSNHQIEIDVLKLLPEIPKEQNYNISLSAWKILLQSESSANVQFFYTSLKPDSIFINLNRQVVKKVPVTLLIDYKIEKNHIETDKPLLNPDSVFVTGPKNILDTLSRISTVYQTIETLNSNTKKHINLNEKQGLICYPKSIEVNFFVERYAEKFFNINPLIINKPDNIDLQLIPNTVKIKTILPLSKFNNFTFEDFLIIGDFSTIKPGENTIFLSIKRNPPHAFNCEIIPPTVEYIVKKR